MHLTNSIFKRIVFSLMNLQKQIQLNCYNGKCIFRLNSQNVINDLLVFQHESANHINKYILRHRSFSFFQFPFDYLQTHTIRACIFFASFRFNT